jgi:hypothetical protein
VLPWRMVFSQSLWASSAPCFLNGGQTTRSEMAPLMLSATSSPVSYYHLATGPLLPST